MGASHHYTELIKNRILNPLPDGTPNTHLHHVYPKCCGGTDFENTIRLTREEHAEAHRLLALIFPDIPQLTKVRGMLDHHYTWEGQHLSPEHRAAIGKANSRPHTEEWKRKVSKALRGRKKPPFTEEHRRRLSEAHKRRHSITQTITQQ